MNTKLIRTRITLLIASGALLMAIGLSIIVSPEAFYGSNNIDVGDDTSLLNELKAPAGFLLVAGLLMIFAGIRRDHVDLALGLSALIYLSYAVSRSISMAFDGVPAEGLILATLLETFIGLLCTFAGLASRAPAMEVS